VQALSPRTAATEGETLALLRAVGTEPSPPPAYEGAMAELFRKHRGGDDEPPS
jgi:hypothetical protein